MRRSNGGIIGPDNVTTGGFSGVASGVWKLNEVTDLIKQNKWPEPSPFPTNLTPNSARFNTASSDYLSLSGSSGGSTTKFTRSMWVKKSSIGVQQYLMDNSGETQIFFKLNAANTFSLGIYASSAYSTQLISNQVLRDSSAWYHIVIAVDYTNSTQAYRARIYINNSEVTSFSTETRPGNTSTTFNTFDSSKTHYISSNGGSNHFLGGYLAEVVHIDGQQLTPSSFGETNSASGIWVPKSVAGLTFGTKGFYLDFKDSSALGNDVSGNNLNYTANNLTSIDQSTDSPSNNWNTWNVLQSHYFWGASETSFASDGNLTLRSGNSQYGFISGTTGISKGKFYWETKIISETASDQFVIGIASTMPRSATNHLGGNQYDYGLYSQNGNLYTNNSSSSFAAGYSPGDTISIAIDYDNAKLYFAKDGAWATGSGAWGSSTFNAATGAQTITTPPPQPTAGVGTGFYFPAWSYWDGGGYGVISSNFGNPPYAISSGNADANGFGNFEYAPPTGYFSLCTNNLNILE